ncbi:hypothetical protein DERP_010583 [Dermatophagoides pteronyssinus]|uniref:Uncharacterized protein n=1 Tax=Dermatophagoides pteronyssinus TaxID=6956 RepID=A0ABQ8JFN8_DERPT|nr:hypothetical protein DERP_010583 [Dermatophagoides pteronyssinus]
MREKKKLSSSSLIDTATIGREKEKKKIGPNGTALKIVIPKIHDDVSITYIHRKREKNPMKRKSSRIIREEQMKHWDIFYYRHQKTLRL